MLMKRVYLAVIIAAIALTSTTTTQIFADGSKTFKVNVQLVGNGYANEVCVDLESGARECQDAYGNGNVEFVFSKRASSVGESFEACAYGSYDGQVCETGFNSDKKAPEYVTLYLREPERQNVDYSGDVDYEFENKQSSNIQIDGNNYGDIEVSQGSNVGDFISGVNDFFESLN